MGEEDDVLVPGETATAAWRFERDTGFSELHVGPDELRDNIREGWLGGIGPQIRLVVDRGQNLTQPGRALARIVLEFEIGGALLRVAASLGELGGGGPQSTEPGLLERSSE